MGEALSIRIEDCQFKKYSGNEFFEAHLRSTKTNPFAQRKETLTLPLSVEHAVPIASEIKKLCYNKKSGRRITTGSSRICKQTQRPTIPSFGWLHKDSIGLPSRLCEER